MRIAFLVPAPDYPEPWRWAFDVEARALIAAGAEVEPVPWTRAGDLAGFDLVLPLVAWGYHLRYADWLAFLDRVERAGMARWPIRRLCFAGTGTRPISQSLPMREFRRFRRLRSNPAAMPILRKRGDASTVEWLVIKPPVSASASGTHRLGPNDDLPADSRRRPMIIQPLIEEIARSGEFSLMLFDGEFSHAVVKRPAAGDFRVQPHLGGVTLPTKRRRVPRSSRGTRLRLRPYMPLMPAWT